MLADDSGQCQKAEKSVVLHGVVTSLEVATVDYQLSRMHSKLVQV